MFKPVKEKTKTDPIFDPFHTTQPPVYKNGAKQGMITRAASEHSRFVPGKRLLISAILLAVCIVSTVVYQTMNTITRSGPATPGIQEGYVPASTCYALESTDLFTQSDHIFVTSHIRKTDPYVETFGGSISYEIYGGDAAENTWVYLPSLSYGEADLYLSSYVWSDAAKDADRLSVSAGFDEDIYVYDFEDYGFLNEGASQEELLKAWQKEYAQAIQCDILYDGVQDQNVSSTSALLKFTSTDSDFSCFYNIRFYNGDQVVFGDTGWCSSGEDDSSYVITQYDAGVRIPHYDRVEVVILP